tara:strand:+ start:2112 stop:3023 length:912 start_codon:yes stop_codon:yes gene_type:complete
MENYLYFAEADVETGDDGASEAICVPASSYIGADPGATSTTLYFKNAMGDNDAQHKVVLTHTAGKNKEVMRGVMACINAHPSKGGFIIVANSNAAAVTTGIEYNEVFKGLGMSTVAITTESLGEGGIVGALSGTTLSTSYGAGMVSTALVPQYSRVKVGDSILTTVKVDLTGLGSANDADDVIGLAAGGAAYFAKYVTAEMGILYKIDMICLELPASGSNNLDDLNLVSNSNATRAYNDDGSGYTQLLNAGQWTAGELQSVASATVAAANDYFYITAGATHSGANTWTGGVFLFKFWGSALES